MRLIVVLFLVSLVMLGQTARNSSGASGNYIINSAYGPLAGSNGPWTIALWFKSNSTGQTLKRLAQFGNSGGTASISIMYGSTADTIEVLGVGYTGTNPATGSGIAIADGGWHHIAYRKSGSGSSEYDKFFDGVKTQISASVDFTLGATFGMTSVLAAVDGGTRVNGAVQDLGVWDSALSDAEIASLAKANAVCARPPAIQPANLLLSWALSGSSPELDTSSGRHNGTVNGTTNVSGRVCLYPRKSRIVQ